MRYCVCECEMLEIEGMMMHTHQQRPLEQLTIIINLKECFVSVIINSNW